jgi:phenylpyruvate tautomerase PptA (4-oxalocrotonate tautomerase family)
MPFIELRTNRQLSPDKKRQIMSDMTDLLARDLNKPQRVIMVQCRDDQDMMFGGSDDPLVLIELRSIRLPEAQTAELSQSLASFVTNHLQIDSDRVFVNFFNVDPHMWGYNGSTF